MLVGGRTSVSSFQALGLVASLLLLLVAIYHAFSFPVHSSGIVVFSILYFVALLFHGRAWLLIMPALCVSYNLAPWSGRFLFNELDILWLVSLAGSLAHYAIQKRLPASPGLFALAFVALSVLSLYGMSLNEVLSEAKGNPYISPSFGFYVSKGVFAAFAFSIFLKAELKWSHQRTLQDIAVGSILASTCLFFIILWERGTLALLFTGSDMYQVIHSFLDFETSYRVTGIIADMHTGGESADGLYLFLIPFNILGFVIFKRPQHRLVAIGASGALAYCVVVGFTRATYLGFAVAIISYLIAEWIRMGKDKRVFRRAVANGGAGVHLFIIALTCVAYQYTGFQALLGLFLTMFLVLLLKRGELTLKQAYKPLIIGAGVFSCYVLLDGYFDSRYSDKSVLNTLIVLMVSLSLYCTAIYAVCIRKMPTPEYKVYGSVFTVLLSSAAIVVGGSHQFNSRMESVERDLETRFEHWNNVIDTSGGTLKELLLGNGWGSFPFNNFSSHPQKLNEIGSLTVEGERDSYLELGPGKMFTVAQRVSLDSDLEYRLSLKAKTESEARLTVGLCKRNLIVFVSWGPPCIRNQIKLEASDDFIEYHISVDVTEQFTDTFLWKHPVSLGFASQLGKPVVQLKDVSLVASNAKEYIKNGSFERGLDYWFFYHDLSHLFWHIKNIYLALFYQVGILGVALVALMIGRFGYSVARGKDSTPLNSAILAMILGYMAFGFFGDPLDSPRVSWMFFLMLFVAGTSPQKSAMQ